MTSIFYPAVIADITGADLHTALQLVFTFTLLFCLVQKELVRGALGIRARALDRALNVAIASLLIGFAWIVIVNLVHSLH